MVLAGARNPQNIGAAARAMQDFGFADLRIMNPFSPPFEAAQMEARSAVGAAEVMRSARLFSSLEEALADCGMVVGTTAIGGRLLARPVLSLQQAAPILHACLELPSDEDLSSSPRTALLFGSEKTGLTNEQLSFCSHLLTIPMFAPEGRHLSMNLGQSVAVCLYEITRDGFEGSRAWDAATTRDATVGDRERLLALLQETMERSGYARRFPANARPEVLRALVGQLGKSTSEAATWMGVFRLVLQRLSDQDEGAELPDRN